jgi:hypothetical protein
MPSFDESKKNKAQNYRTTSHVLTPGAHHWVHIKLWKTGQIDGFNAADSVSFFISLLHCTFFFDSPLASGFLCGFEERKKKCAQPKASGLSSTEDNIEHGAPIAS